MSTRCVASIHLCAVRVTRLDQLGNPTAGPKNVYVTNNPIQLGVTPVISEGEDKELVGGCDCLVATYRGFDKLKRFDLELDQAKLEPALLEMLLGADAIVDGSDVIGIWWPNQITCDDEPQPNVCFEAWSSAWEDDHQLADLPWIHWIWPSTHWSIDQNSLANDFNQPKVKGWSRGNPQWGLGIYGDLPEAAQPLGGWFLAEDVPDAQCAYQTQSIT